mgnify:CR=1 FL=1
MNTPNNSLSISLNQMSLHSKAYDQVKKINFKQRLNLRLGAKQYNRKETSKFWQAIEINITALPKGA